MPFSSDISNEECMSPVSKCSPTLRGSSPVSRSPSPSSSNTSDSDTQGDFCPDHIIQGLSLNFDYQSEARETILNHASQRLIAIEADLKSAETCFALKRQALAQLGDECMLLRRAFLEGSLATLYFRRAFDLGTNTIDPMNDTMTVPVAAAAAGPVPLRTYHSQIPSRVRTLPLSPHTFRGTARARYTNLPGTSRSSPGRRSA
ncbi:hypothetical protein FIBSPDRAFT_953396 [Athelia psychrophila]|uniref:Uncharacterized protein n=1 Tax=Athelia psychrophila TaxID=1759441 RepID=A0A166KG47_9AGAM|nr:hypothetical protein FIBSPDRAFT_953396 [Fibularhizoctonia sp. CBS 109695]